MTIPTKLATHDEPQRCFPSSFAACVFFVSATSETSQEYYAILVGWPNIITVPIPTSSLHLISQKLNSSLLRRRRARPLIDCWNAADFCKFLPSFLQKKKVHPISTVVAWDVDFWFLNGFAGKRVRQNTQFTNWLSLTGSVFGTISGFWEVKLGFPEKKIVETLSFRFPPSG